MKNENRVYDKYNDNPTVKPNVRKKDSRGLSLHVFFTSETDIWVQISRRKVGLSGNILVKLYIPKSKFDNVFDIRKEYCL